MQRQSQKSQHLGCTVTCQAIALLSVRESYRLSEGQQEIEKRRLEGWYIVVFVWDIEL